VNTVKYVMLEPSAFLTDIDFLMMNAEQRGVYCSIIFYLYCNDGKLLLGNNGDITLLHNQTSQLATISGCYKLGAAWDAVWSKIAPKFEINGNLITHKRVTEELKKAKDFIEQKSEAGKKGMASRYGRNTVITKEKKRKEKKSKVSNNTDGYGVDFEKFWSIYPKKVGKGDACRFWDRINPSAKLLEKILVAVEQQKKSRQWKKDKGQYIPNPATWLNQKRWDDKLEIEDVGSDVSGKGTGEYHIR